MTNGDASSTPEEASKRLKKDGPSTQPATGLDVDEDSPAVAHARAAAAYIPFLTPEMLMPPKMPTTEEMEKVLLDLQKKVLVEEYFGNEGS
jgi:pre-mRNA-splicing factor ISY1